MKTYQLCGIWEAYKEESKEHIYEVKVPGSWNEVKGLEEYTGCLIYKKIFSINDEDINKYMELRFGGVYCQCEVYLNGEKLLSHRGYQAPFKADITGKVLLGENILEVKASNVDPHPEIPSGDLFRVIPLNISGIYESVTLELTDNIKIESVYTPISLEKQEAVGIIGYKCFENIDHAKLRVSFKEADVEVYASEFDFAAEKGEGEFKYTMPLAGYQLWSPENPLLYDAEVTVLYGNQVETFTVKTGFKTFEAKGREFYLNGMPYYLLGYGDDFVYPLGVPDAEDKRFYFPGIQKAKEYGFNYVRHHSHFPYEAYLDACDELGLLIQPELFLANVPRETLNDENKYIYVQQWVELIKAYRHHPCIALWCGGNEMEWGFFFENELYKIEKELDPYRLTANTDGNFTALDVGEYADFASVCPSEYTDYLPYREMNDMFTRDDSGKPQIVHEMGNYATMPNIADIKKYENAVVRHKKMDDLKNLLNEKKAYDVYNKAYQGSLDLQKRCHKLNIEKARLSPFFAGYHVWTLVDYYNTTQGILNPFYEDKAFTSEEFSRINNQEILLWDTETVTFSANEDTLFNIKLSKYGSDEEIKGILKIRSSFGFEKTIEKSFIGHGVMDAASISLKMPDCQKEEAFTLEATFVYENGEIKNSWEFYVFPNIKIRKDKEAYIHYLSRHIFEKQDVHYRIFTIPQPIDERQIIVTDTIYGGMLEAVEEKGTNMLFLAREDTFKATIRNNSFKPPWWEIGTIWYLNHTNNVQVCGIVEQHPAAEMIPYTGSWRLDLFDAVEMAPSIDIEKTGLNADVILYGTDLQLKKYAYLFEFKLGKGKILVASFNHQLDNKSKSIKYFLRSLVNYCMSDQFDPKSENTREMLENAMA